MKKQIEQDRDVMLSKVARLRKLVAAKDSGWITFYALMRNYIDACKRRKLGTRLDTASSEVIEQLKLLDHEIFTIEFILNIPQQYIDKVERAVEQEKKRNEREELAKKGNIKRG